MKFLLFGLVFAIAFCAASAQNREALLKRAEDLEARATAAVQKLKDAGKDTAVLEAEERRVVALAAEVRSAHVGVGSEARLRMLEASLVTAESRLDAELKKVEAASGLVKRDARSDALLKRAEDLETRAKAAVQKLKDAGKNVVLLEAEERRVVTLAEEVRTAHTGVGVLGEVRLRMLEASLVAAESRLDAELKRVEADSGLVKRDAKAELLVKAAELLNKSGPLIKLLESQGKPLLVAAVKEIEHIVIEAETKLKNLNPTSELGKAAQAAAEEVLKVAENKLEAEIKKLSSALVKRDLKTDLMTKAAELLGKSGGIIALLESQGKPLLAEGVRAVENLVKSLETKLETMHPSSEIGKLALAGAEELLKLAETKLEEEIKKLGAALF